MNFYFLLSIVIFNQDVLTVDIKKLFYEKDLSEFCKRRVIPSIFLGRHVVEASSFILHFTKLNLPYNCFISVRTESGSNMIMVITLPYDSGLEQSCSSNSPQLLVYEMGETFGGYWGVLPEAMLSQEPSKIKFYTLKTTRQTTERTEPSTEEYIETTTPTPTPYVEAKTTEDFLEVEVPIVDVSGHLVPGPEQPPKAFDFEEAFDYQYDVTPIPGVKYDTSILPLVQLSVRKQPEGRRDQEPRYELDVLEEFTPDARLTVPQFKSTPFSNAKKNKAKVNSRLMFGKSRATKNPFYRKFRTTTKYNYRNLSTKYVFPTTIKTNKKLKSWEMIDMLMETLNKKKAQGNILKDKNQYNKNDDTSRIAENISNVKHNSSIYLKANLSMYNEVKSDNLLQFRTTTLPPRSAETYLRKNVQTNEKTTLSKNENVAPKSILHNKTNIAIQEATTISTPVESLLTSKTEGNKYKSTSEHFSGADSQKDISIKEGSSMVRTIELPRLERKKRAIQSISIESDRPHNLTTKAKISTTTKGNYDVSDMQEFARLVELQDDNMHGRLSLRYMKQFVGPALYNICGNAQPFNRHVYLFNSSRIVLSLNNFTLRKISVIITAARTLLSGEIRCSSSQLECQVSGARVCVDSLSACDGVPNCGSYDIYDEDRLMCGAAEGFQNNVYLAAFTFLALLLTLFYAVHYWIKQCVPKVAEAFFVYTEGVENILYLDSIMRPPGDYNNDSKMFYSGNIESLLNSEFIQDGRPKKSLCSRLLGKCFFCFGKKEQKEEDEHEHEHEIDILVRNKTFSFTQMELHNMLVRPTVDTSVQTGDSLDMVMIDEQSDNKLKTNVKSLALIKNVRDKSIIKTMDPPMMIRDSLLTLDEPLPEDELNLMKFFRDSRSDSSDSFMMKERYQRIIPDLETGRTEMIPPGDEKELSNVVQDRGINTEPGPSGVKGKSKKNRKVSSLTHKRIRFKEGATVIPFPEYSNDENDDGDDDDEDCTHQRQVFSGLTRTWRSQHLSTIKEDEESGSKHRHFWEGKGRKRSAKKTNVNLRKQS